MREERLILFFFLGLILTGSILLALPVSWKGAEPLPYTDALFTATSAVCVTGLITVDTAAFSLFGKTVILLLIQFGGLGLITFSTFFLVLFSRKLSLAGRKSVKEYYLESIPVEPRSIIRQIVFMTLAVETAGAVLLAPVLPAPVGVPGWFNALFHSVSAFCNAGFSLYSNNLEDFVSQPLVNIVIPLLIILGGIGFVVLRDVVQFVLRKNRILAFHTRIVLTTTLFLIIAGTVLFLLLETRNTLAGLPPGEKIMASVFQAITPRTAGFNTLPIGKLRPVTQVVLLPFMYVGGAPGSLAGGVKVTTLFILFQLIFKRMDNRKRISAFQRKIPANILLKSLVFFLRTLIILTGIITALALTFRFTHPHQELQLLAIVFESFSAFGTVGLSLGLTPDLSIPGKIIITLTMMTGRFGLVILSMRIFNKIDAEHDHYTEDEVLIG